MEIRLIRSINSKRFYDEYLPLLMKYARDSKDNNLILDLQETLYLSPSVLCDILSAINYIKWTNPEKMIHLVFGWNTPLVAFLNNTDFFLMADTGRTITTDVIDYSYSNDSYRSYSRFMSKKDNTDKIRRVILPTYYDIIGYEKIYHFKGKDIESEKERIDQNVQTDYYSLLSRKERSIDSLGLSDYDSESLAYAFSDMVFNSYCHGGGGYCFYTFQNYNNSGLSFVCGDTAMGLYSSIKEKKATIEQVIHEYRGANTELPERPIFLFSEEQFLQVAKDYKIRSLVGIFEGILYRYFNRKYYFFDRGIVDIIKIILGTGRYNNAIIRIYSDYAMLQIDSVSLPKLFEGVEEERDKKGAYQNIIPKYQMFRDIALDEKVRKAWIASGHIAFTNFCFPGLHISATIDSQKWNEGSRQ